MLSIAFPDRDTCVSGFGVHIVISGFRSLCQLLQSVRSQNPGVTVGNSNLAVIFPNILAFPVSVAILISGYPPASHLFEETSFGLLWSKALFSPLHGIITQLILALKEVNHISQDVRNMSAVSNLFMCVLI